VARQNPAQYPGLADKLQHALLPKGPSGRRFNGVLCLQHAIMRHSPNQEAAMDFVRFLMAPENYEKWFVISSGYTMGPGRRWRDHGLWTRDPRLTVFRDLPATARMTGYAGPYNQKASEAQAKYIIVDVFAKAVQGESPEAAVAWAEKELKNVYERA
jgi:multiple sugar transport system substrate-binding protein